MSSSTSATSDSTDAICARTLPTPSPASTVGTTPAMLSNDSVAPRTTSNSPPPTEYARGLSRRVLPDASWPTASAFGRWTTRRFAPSPSGVYASRRWLVATR
jgi:hypothetical protein